KDNGLAVQVGQYVPVSDLAAAKFVYSAPPNVNGAALTAFTFQVKDDGGTAGGRIDLDPVPRTMTINVQSVNDPPIGMNRTIALSACSPSHILTAVDFGF